MKKSPQSKEHLNILQNLSIETNTNIIQWISINCCAILFESEKLYGLSSTFAKLAKVLPNLPKSLTEYPKNDMIKVNLELIIKK